MLEYIQVKLNTPEDFKSALECKETSMIPNDHNYLCYEVAVQDYVYSTSTSTWDVLVKDFKEFNQAILMTTMGIPLEDISKCLSGV